MRIYDLSKLSLKEQMLLTTRKKLNEKLLRQRVQLILDQVSKNGDQAVKSFTKDIDNVSLDKNEVSKDEIEESKKTVPEELKEAIHLAKRNIEKFHKEDSYKNNQKVETLPGVLCYSEMRPIEKVGLYVPGGTAPLLSTALMLCIPAKLAGCEEIVVSSPPNRRGLIEPSILYAASVCGATRIFKVGGAQAIAAMAYGTNEIPQVYKIFGPGNQYVTMAKQLISSQANGVSIDMPAGPTEQLIIADKTARSNFVAADILSQAEHGPDSQVVLATVDRTFANKVIDEIQTQLETLPRAEIAKDALKNSFCVIGSTQDSLIAFSNLYAPEHLLIQTSDPDEVASQIKNAGSVFLGSYATESAGDYASGTNHALPTSGYARVYSGLSVLSFQKKIAFQKVSKQGAKNLAPIVTLLARAEMLEGHARAIEIRSQVE